MFEERAEDLYEQAPCGYLSVLEDGSIVRVNETLLRWTGHARESLMAGNLSALLTGGGKLYFETHLRPMLQAQGRVREIALELVCADGRRLPVLLNATTVQGPSGERITRATVLDASERREYERQLVRARTRVEQLLRVTAAMGAAVDVDDIVEVLRRELTEHQTFSACALALMEHTGDRLELQDRHASPELVRRWARAMSGGDLPDVDQIATTGPEFRSLGRARALFPAAAEAIPDDGMLAILPLLVGDRTIGVLCVVSASAKFAEDERANLAAIADLAAQTVDRARLAALAKRNAARSGFLAEMGRTIEPRRTVTSRAQQVVDLLVPYVADYATIETADRGAVPVAAAHADPAHLDPLIRLRERKNLAGGNDDPVVAAIATGKPHMSAGDTDVPPSDGDVDALIPCSSVALPLRGWGGSVGALLLAYSTSKRRYVLDDLTFLTTLADRVGLALETARLYERERAVSYTLQHSLMAGELPSDPRARIAVHYESGAGDMEVGGDWHNEFMLDDRTLAVVVGDVVGRGLAAAATMGQLRSAVRALSMAGLGVGAVLDELERFVEAMPEAHMATLIYAQLDLETGALQWGCTGHPPPLLLAPNTAPAYLWDGRSMPLGVQMAHGDRPVGTQLLTGGSVLFFYTDGVVERRDESMDVGLERLANVAAARTPEPFDSLADDLVEMMQVGRGAAEDDVCLVCLSFEGS